MFRTPVTSSNIKSVGYDLASHTLEVEFTNGGIYDYSNVPETLYSELMRADSIGSYLSKFIIKAGYAHKKVA